MNPYLIASYPRSGSTWLRFTLCHLLYPRAEGHDFDSVNRHIPPIDDPAGMKIAIANPLFYKTHHLHHGQNIIFLHRHVGDVLVSEWWYKRKFHEDTRTLEAFLEASDYGAGWREFCNHYFPCRLSFGFVELGRFPAIELLMDGVFGYSGIPSVSSIEAALELSSFARLQEVEKKGFGIYPTGDQSIPFFREGTSGQWQKAIRSELHGLLIEKNFTQLKMLQYL